MGGRQPVYRCLIILSSANPGRLHLDEFESRILTKVKKIGRKADLFYLVPLTGLDLHFRPGMGDNE